MLIVNVQVVLDTSYWTGINHFFIWASILFYFAANFSMFSNGWYTALGNFTVKSFPFVGEEALTEKWYLMAYGFLVQRALISANSSSSVLHEWVRPLEPNRLNHFVSGNHFAGRTIWSSDFNIEDTYRFYAFLLIRS